MKANSTVTLIKILALLCVSVLCVSQEFDFFYFVQQLGRRDGSMGEEVGVGRGEVGSMCCSVEGASSMVMGDRGGVDEDCVGQVDEGVSGDWGEWAGVSWVVTKGELRVVGTNGVTNGGSRIIGAEWDGVVVSRSGGVPGSI
ncbi:hypothetical protein DKX38_012614 [Salix brachista]|uniref:Uncharacterized protein n=1 Tax=Salix brachista TaxID=2182728 RepID=A0A5N5LPG6_9ROSI|nr:hypothetical protein DKX38_012614 [Salix brachista]